MYTLGRAPDLPKLSTETVRFVPGVMLGNWTFRFLRAMTILCCKEISLCRFRLKQNPNVEFMV